MEFKGKRVKKLVAEWRQEGGSGHDSTETRSSARRGGEKTSERLVRMCAVLFQRVLGWCYRMNCVNTPYGATCRRVFSSVLPRKFPQLWPSWQTPWWATEACGAIQYHVCGAIQYHACGAIQYHACRVLHPGVPFHLFGGDLLL